MNRLTLQHGCLVTLALLAAPAFAFSQNSGRLDTLLVQGFVSGMIRDTDGTPQTGALVEAVLPDATLGASAITDSRGQYRFSLRPGSYRIRASAALLLPAIRERLQVAGGTRAVVNLTLSTVLAPGGWLPISRRSTTEPNDDWMWTLRSSASRSILRLAAPENAEPNADAESVSVSSSRQESRKGNTSGRITINNSDGGFGRGGSHNILLLTRLNEDGSGAVLRADLSGTRSPYPVAPSAEISAGMQRRTPLSGFSRVIVTYSSHPELLDSRGVIGMQGVTVRSAQRIEVGDLLRVDVGSVLRSANFGVNALLIEPFLRIAAHPGSGVVLAYSMTEAHGTESLEDLDRVQSALPSAAFKDGHLRLRTGSHHALSLTSKMPGGGTTEFALYHDRLKNPIIAGTGVLSPADVHQDGLVADPTTRTYRVVAADYSSAGVRLLVRQPLTKSMQAGAEVSSGSALRAPRMQSASMAQILHQLTPAESYTASAFLDGRIQATGSTVRASYRFQPARTLSAVDAYQIGEDGAFLSCSLRQSLAKLPFMPHGLEAMLDVQNLLAEGYQSFLSSDGRTLYLAQTPRTLQAGLSFSF